MLLYVIEESQYEIFIVGKDGTVLFANQKAMDLLQEEPSFKQLLDKVSLEKFNHLIENPKN